MVADRELVLQNFETLAENEVVLSDRTYDLLFEAHPELLELFSAKHSAGGRQMVRETLMYAVDHVNGETWVAMNLASLGAKHVEYEVTEVMYEWLIDAMIDAMAEVSGSTWTAELGASWRDVLRYLADLMIAELPPGKQIGR